MWYEILRTLFHFIQTFRVDQIVISMYRKWNRKARTSTAVQTDTDNEEISNV